MQSKLSGQDRHQQTIRRLHATLVNELGEDPEKTEKRCRADLTKGYDEGGGKGGKKAKKGNR